MAMAMVSEFDDRQVAPHCMAMATVSEFSMVSEF